MPAVAPALRRFDEWWLEAEFDAEFDAVSDSPPLVPLLEDWAPKFNGGTARLPSLN